jgi:3-deoxy-7-phosphoheptulonate synthase
MEKKPVSIMAIGAHIGDMELTAGEVLAKHAILGDKITLVHLTAGEKGNPPSMTVDEWLNAAEYIMNEGNYNVVLCERGIRTFENSTRYTLDISSIPVVKSNSHLPIIADPSHAAGKSQYVVPLSKAAIAAGADGLIVEVHPNPRCALSDAAQQLTPDDFDKLCSEISGIAGIIGRKF